MLRNIISCSVFLALLTFTTVSCGGSDGKEKAEEQQEVSLHADGKVAGADQQGVITALPYSGDSIAEHVVMDYGNRAIRTDADKTISNPTLVKNKQNLFIVMSKKDYYLYVYEPQGADTVLIARYDCAFSLKKGQKERSGDMRTPHTTMAEPFSIQQIQDASTWAHDFGDGRGSILSYGAYFLRLATPGHKGIGIHGSTNNRESVPGRASEGCIRLKDEDIKDLAEHYASVDMKVVIKAEDIDDLPFEIHAMEKQQIVRKRHFNPSKTLSNEQIAAAKAEQGRTAKQAGQKAEDAAEGEGKGIPVDAKDGQAAPQDEGSGKGVSLDEFNKKK